MSSAQYRLIKVNTADSEPQAAPSAVDIYAQAAAPQASAPKIRVNASSPVDPECDFSFEEQEEEDFDPSAIGSALDRAASHHSDKVGGSGTAHADGESAGGKGVSSAKGNASAGKRSGKDASSQPPLNSVRICIVGASLLATLAAALYCAGVIG